MARTTARTTARTYNNRNRYNYGSAAPDFDVREAIYAPPAPRMSEEGRRYREKSRSMTAGYVLLIAVAMAVAGLTLFQYVRLQAANKNAITTIAEKLSQLSALTIANDELYSEITSNVDLEYVKEVAIKELGMQYAEEGQIVTVESQSDDYVRQFEEMP